MAGWVFNKISDNLTFGSYMGEADIKGNIPKFILNKCVSQAASSVVQLRSQIIEAFK